MRTEFLCISVLRVASGPRVKLASCKSAKIRSLFPKRGNHNTKRTEKHKNKMPHGKTYNKSPRRINHKATKSKTNTVTTPVVYSTDRSKEVVPVLVLLIVAY